MPTWCARSQPAGQAVGEDAAIEGVVKPAGSLLLGVASYAYGVIASVSCGLLSAENESEARPKRA